MLQRYCLWYNEGKVKVSLTLTTALIAASAFFLALFSLIFVLRDRERFSTRRDFDKLLDEFDEWKDHIRVAIGRAARLKRDTVPVPDDVQPSSDPSSSAAEPSGEGLFRLTKHQSEINAAILKRRAKI